MQGAVRLELNNVPGAANSFRRALEFDRAEIDKSPDPTKLRKVIARTFRSCPINPSKGCVECHMPPVRIDSLHMNLTDHYIRLNRPKS
jgi:hypothetical protein